MRPKQSRESAVHRKMNLASLPPHPIVAYLHLVTSIGALVAAVAVVLVAGVLATEHQFVSPNGEFEAYTIAANVDGTGMKLYLRRANSGDAGVPLRQNDRWISAKWSPDSHFVAVFDHLEDISDVYVFGATTAADPMLLYHTPDLHSYDVKWGGCRLGCIPA